MNASPLTKAILRIKQLQEVLKEQPEGWDVRTIPAKMVQRRSAEEEVKSIMDGFKKLISEQVAKVYVIGTDPKKVAEAKLLGSELGGVVIDASELYTRIAAPAYSLYQQTNRVNLDVTLAIEHDIMLAAQQHNLTPTDFPRVPANFLESSFEEPEAELTAIARKATESVFGTELAQALVTELTFSETLRLESDETPVPVVIVGLTEQEATDFERRGFFAGRPSVTVKAGKNVEGALKSAAAKLIKLVGKTDEVPPATGEQAPATTVTDSDPTSK